MKLVSVKQRFHDIAARVYMDVSSQSFRQSISDVFYRSPIRRARHSLYMAVDTELSDAKRTL